MVTTVKSLYAGFNLCFVLSSHLNPIEHFSKDLKMAMERCSLMELKMFCKEELEKMPKNRLAKPVAPYSRSCQKL